MPGSEELERKEGPSTQESTHSTFNSNNTRSTEKEEAVVVEPPRNAVQRQLEQILRNSAWLRRFMPRENPYDYRPYSEARWNPGSRHGCVEEGKDEEETSDSEAEFYNAGDDDEAHYWLSSSSSASCVDQISQRTEQTTRSTLFDGESIIGSSVKHIDKYRKRSLPSTRRVDEDGSAYAGKERQWEIHKRRERLTQEASKHTVTGERGNLKVEKIRELDEYDCSICLRPMTRRSVSVVIPCFHKFDACCIRTWLRSLRKQFRSNPRNSRPPHCPLCKTLVTHLIYNIRSQQSYRARRYVRSSQLGDKVDEHGQLHDELTRPMIKSSNTVRSDHGEKNIPHFASPRGSRNFPRARVAVRKLRIKKRDQEPTAITELSCTKEETNRVRNELGMNPLRE